MTKGPGIKTLCQDLIKSGFDLSCKDALEVFGRKGDWHTVDYADGIRSLEVWEIDSEHNTDLRRNLPNAVVKNVDSIQFSREPQNVGRFDFVVIDNPQALYGPNNEYCEHFDVLESGCAMLRPGGVLVFNVNIRPYDFEKHPEWKRRREEFYGKPDTASLSLEELLEFYGDLFARWRKHVISARHYRRNDFLHYLIFRFEGDVTTAPERNQMDRIEVG